LAGKIYYIDNVLSLYRIHDNNMSRIENLFNLKVNCIANQLNKDRILAYKLDLIGSRLNFLLKLKILFYEKFQFYNTSILKNKVINKYLSKFILLLYKSLTFSFINYEK
jgi:hypothetical protein